MTQAGFAKRLGVSAQQLQKYESGENRMRVGTLHAAAVILHIPIIDFIDESNDITPLDSRQSQRYRALLEHFTQLNTYQQQSLITYLRAMTKED